MVRASDGTRYTAPTFRKLSARVYHEGIYLYVQRVIYELRNPNTPPFRAKQVCQTTGCVSPHHNHWVFSPVSPLETLPEVEVDEGWTLEEASDLVDGYLNINPYPPADPGHNLLVDIPPDLLKEAFTKIGRGDFLP